MTAGKLVELFKLGEEGANQNGIRTFRSRQWPLLVYRCRTKSVIVAKLDRLTRSVKDLAELLERLYRRGVSLVSVAESLDTGSASGRLVLNIMTAVSQWGREAIGERTRDALSHKKPKGERVGTVPFGYELAPDGVHLDPEPAEQAMLDKIRELRASGYTLRQIADELNGRGFRTRCGSLWRHQYIQGTISSASSNNRRPERASQDNSGSAGRCDSPPSLTTPTRTEHVGLLAPIFSQPCGDPTQLGGAPRWRRTATTRNTNLTPELWVVDEANGLSDLEARLNHLADEGFTIQTLFLLRGLKPEFVILANRPEPESDAA